MAALTLEYFARESGIFFSAKKENWTNSFFTESHLLEARRKWNPILLKSIPKSWRERKLSDEKLWLVLNQFNPI